MLDLHQVIQQVKIELWSLYSASVFPDTEIYNFINAATNRITLNNNFSFSRKIKTIEVEEWKTEYPIPFQIETIGVKIWWVMANIVSYQDYFLSGQKDSVYVWEDVLYYSWWKKWEKIELFYKWFPKNIINWSQVIEDIPSSLEYILICYAVAEWYRKVRQYDIMGIKYNEWDKLIEKMRVTLWNQTPSLGWYIWWKDSVW